MRNIKSIISNLALFASIVVLSGCDSVKESTVGEDIWSGQLNYEMNLKSVFRGDFYNSDIGFGGVVNDLIGVKFGVSNSKWEIVADYPFENMKNELPFDYNQNKKNSEIKQRILFVGNKFLDLEKSYRISVHIQGE